MRKAAVARKDRKELTKWELVFRALCSLDSTGTAVQAGQRVFNLVPSLTPVVEAKTTCNARTPEMLVLGMQRVLALSNYRLANPTASERSIYKELRIDKRDWYRWKGGQMKDESCMAARIAGRITILADAKDSPHSPH